MQPAPTLIPDINSISLFTFTQQPELDKKEKATVIEALKDLKSNRPVKVSGTFHPATFPRTAGSTFDTAEEFVRVALSKLIASDAFSSLKNKYHLPSNALVSVDEHAVLWVLKDGIWIDLTHDGESFALQDELQMLAECTLQTGGCVFSGPVIGVEQWLRYHQFDIPVTDDETQSLIDFLEFEMPSAPATGDYHELLMEPPESAFHLSTADRQTIRDVIDETTHGQTSLLHYIALKNFSAFPDAVRRERAGGYLKDFLKRAKVRTLGETLHKRLEWHLDTDHPDVATRQLDYLVVTALILDLVSDVDRHSKAVAGLALYQPANASRTASDIVLEVEQHLVANTLLEPHNASLAAHLLLSGVAPEFLVQGVPDELTIDKPGWVVLTQAVALVEAAAPGTSRLMKYSDIMAFSDLAPVSKAQRLLHEVTAIRPIIHWAMLNELIPYIADTDYDVATFNTAASYFTQYAEALNQTESGLSVTPPNRRKLALEALKRVMPGGDYLEQRVYKIRYVASLKERNFLDLVLTQIPLNIPNIVESLAHETGVDSLVFSRVLNLRASILDLYMSDDLEVGGQFNNSFVATTNLKLPKGAFSRLSKLESVDELFDAAFDQYYPTLQNGLASVIKMAITQLPEEDRKFLINGSTTLYTVRNEVNPLNAFQETQRQRNAAKGRYGIILGSRSDGEFRCYELFPLKGLCRARPDLATLIQSRGVIDDTPELSYVGAETDFQDKRFEQPWPLDFAAYLDGSEPRSDVSSRVVVEKLWHFTCQSNDARPVPLFFSVALDALAESVLSCHPMATREELYTLLNTRTELQQLRDYNNALDTSLVNVLVPFKKCIEDINSGDAERVTEGVGGCVLDGLALLGLIIGFGASVAGIVARTASMTSKVLKIAKASAHFALSLVNPLDGLPTLVLKGARLTRRGVLLLTGHAIEAVETATGQLRRLAGSAQSYDLIKAAQKSDLLQGTWKAVGDLGESKSLIALERNSDWRALNLRTGGPWGPALKNFKVAATSPLRKLFNLINPFSYTRTYVSKAIPLARTKLDNAIALLSKAPDDDVRSILKYVFGSDSDEALNYLLANLKVMRKDLDSVTLANMSFKRGSEAAAALRTNAYKRWKTSVLAGGTVQDSTEHFLVIYKDGLDDLYRISRYDEARIADALIHEMSHGAPQTLDFYYGYPITSGSGAAPIDAAGLIDFAKDAKSAHPDNLVNPHFSSAQPPSFTEFQASINSQPDIVRQHPALRNADSYSLAVSLLDQSRSNPRELMFNLAYIKGSLEAADKTKYKFIQGTLPIQLARPKP